MVFIKEILLNKKQVNIDLRAHHSLQLSPSKPTLSLKTLKRDKDSLKAIHFTNTQVYEYFPDWFRSGSMNSPITQVSIKLDRFIPFKVLQLVCMQKKLILMHTFAWLKQQYHGLNNTHQLPLF